MLLMMVMIGAFIPAAQAVHCYACDRAECGDPFTDSTGSCTGEVCSEEIVETEGWFTMHLLKLLLHLTCLYFTHPNKRLCQLQCTCFHIKGLVHIVSLKAARSLLKLYKIKH